MALPPSREECENQRLEKFTTSSMDNSNLDKVRNFFVSGGMIQPHRRLYSGLQIHSLYSKMSPYSIPESSF
jgi:hypothetical protein